MFLGVHIFWGDNLFKEYNLMNSVIKKFDKLDIAICEPKKRTIQKLYHPYMYL